MIEISYINLVEANTVSVFHSPTTNVGVEGVAICSLDDPIGLAVLGLFHLDFSWNKPN